MKRYFLIFLLLVSFNANAIAGTVMMLDMSLMASSIEMNEQTMQHDSHTTDSNHHSKVMTISDHCKSEISTNDSCEEQHNCGACVAHCSSALLTDIHKFNISNRFNYESNYRLWDTPSTYSRLLRPPKLA